MDNRTAIVLDFQNASAFEDQIGYVELFHAMGIRIVQMAYNTQNYVGSGCYETKDGGLSDFGRDVIAEMNRVGILYDLSHVGANTSRDVIEASTRPVCYSHCLPAGLKAHPRNKSDDELRFIVAHGSFVGVTIFPPFLPKSSAFSVDDYVVPATLTCSGLHSSAGWLALIGLTWLTFGEIIGGVWLTLHDRRLGLCATGLHSPVLAHAVWD